MISLLDRPHGFAYWVSYSLQFAVGVVLLAVCVPFVYLGRLKRRISECIS